jgi:hypothetical protein
MLKYSERVALTMCPSLSTRIKPMNLVVPFEGIVKKPTDMVW